MAPDRRRTTRRGRGAASAAVNGGLNLSAVLFLAAAAIAIFAASSVLPSPSLALATMSRSSSRRGRHSGRLLGKPNPVKCARRPKQLVDQGSGHFYFISEDTKYRGHEMGWLDARNLCRELCMDLVSIETPEENSAVAELIRERNLRSVWTSGRLCNFQGCNAPHLQPRHINGWFWAGSMQTIAATNSTPRGWPETPWSRSGFIGQFLAQPVPQPDNAEYMLNPSLATVEACLSINNDWYGDGISWHDTACFRKKSFICEDSEVLMRRARMLSPTVVL